MDKFIHVLLFWLCFTLYRKHKHFLCMQEGSIYVCDLDPIHPLTVKVELIIIIGSDMDTIDPIAVGNKFINGINLNSDKLNKYEYNYVTNNNITIITKTFYTIRGAAIEIVFLVDVVYFLIPLMDKSSLNITLSIELNAIIVEIVQLILHLGLQSSITAVDCNTQVVHHVCAVFYCIFLYF